MTPSRTPSLITASTSSFSRFTVHTPSALARTPYLFESDPHLAQELVGEPGVFEELCRVHGADLALLVGVEATVVDLILCEVRPGYLK